MKVICEQYFGSVLKESGRLLDYNYDLIPVEKLIDENLHEKDARHLMIIGKSDSIVNILTYHLRSLNMDPMVLCGSQFPDDAEGDYSYGVLSRVMVKSLNYSWRCVCWSQLAKNYLLVDVR